jgi:hypothetical protein
MGCTLVCRLNGLYWPVKSVREHLIVQILSYSVQKSIDTAVFTINTEVHEINTRHKLDLHVPSVRLTRIQKGLYYSGTILYNSLPCNIKKVVCDVDRFKHKLKGFLIVNPFYSVDEYLSMNDR